jgi:hypothetical protein
MHVTYAVAVMLWWLLVAIHLHCWLPYTYIVGCHTLTLLVAIHLHPLPFVQRRAQVVSE